MLSKRESQLIELLLEEEGFQPASFFSEKLNVSNKTIYQDIQKLGQFLNRFELKIEKKPRIGIYLIGKSTKKNDVKIFITSKEALSTEVKYSSNYRRVYLFANLIFKTDKKRYEYFEKNIGVGKGSNNAILYPMENRIGEKCMDQKTFIVLLICGVIVLLIALDLNARRKLKESIHKKWGRVPYQPRFDKEKSLKEAWLTEKEFRSWSSEVDDLTWYDLDMFEVFEGINLTYSSIGSEALYQRLRSFDFGKDQQLEKLITFYQENPQTREKIQYQFARLGKKDGNFTKQYLADGQSKQIGHVGFYTFLGLLPIIGLILLLFGQVLGIYLAIGSLIFNTLYYQVKKQTLETEINSMGYLVSTISTANQVAKIATPVRDELRQNVKPLKDIPKFGFSFRVKSGSEAEILFDYVNMMFMLPFISYHFVISRLEKKTKEAMKVWELLGEMEVAAAVLNYRTYMPITCQPEFMNNGVEAEDLYHPLLKEAVVNPVDWHQNILVTGSNASGKSTYVKSIAINCILAQTIQTALAEKFTLQHGHVLTSMAIEDDLFVGDSYFVSEIKSIKRLLDQVEKGERCYCFVYEILKGTNTIERIASSAAVVRWLADYPSLAFVATHDIELTEILKNECENVHFEEQVTAEKGISFDFRLKKGPATTRNAIALLKVLDYPGELVENAKEEAMYFDQNRTWRVFE